MKYLEKNRESLQKYYPEIAERLEGKIEKEFEIDHVSTREDARAMVVTGEAGTVRFNSTYRPLQEAVKWADQYSFQNIDINVLMFGLGNGIFVRELLKRLAKDSRLFLVEPREEIFSDVLENEDISDILADERLHLYVGADYELDFRNTVGDAVNWDNLSTQIRCEHPGYQKLLQKEYHIFWDAVDRINDSMVIKANTNAYFAHQAVDNI